MFATMHNRRQGSKIEQRNPAPSTDGWISDTDEEEIAPAVITPPSIKTESKSMRPRRQAPLPSLRTMGSLPLSEPNTPASSTISNSYSQWKEAMDMIRENPDLLTPRVFWTTLEQNPPKEVIEFMLSISPQVASIPKQGPTALQVAVQHGASLGVVQAVLQACPFALCVTNPHHALDPLSYAKRHRKGESDLLELLSRPLSDWIQTNKHPRDTVNNNESNQEQRTDYGVQAAETKTPSDTPSFFPVSNPSPKVSTTPGSNNSRKSLVDRQELNNVKLLCAQVLKGHKKLARQMKACQERLDALPQPETLLDQVQQQQQDQFRRQLIALDMKERAFLARVQKMETTCQQHIKDQLLSLQQSLDAWKSESTDQWKEWKVLLDHERQVNARFRDNLSQWMEDRNRDESQDDDFDFNEEDDDGGKENDETPIVFATNLGETDECTPLRGSSSSSSSSSGEDEMVHVQSSRGGVYTQVVHADGNDDELIQLPFRRPYLVRRKHPWNPLVRKWDRITL